MKTKLLYLTLFLLFNKAFSQDVTIVGDEMLCPNSTGMAFVVSNVNYDSYTWYYKYWFTTDEFQMIPGQFGPSLTYDWYTYDQALIKVVVTTGGQTLESNTIQIDSYNWLPISMGFQESENTSIDPETGNVLLCAGTNFTISVNQPFGTNIRWYRDGELIPNENSMSLVVYDAGTYHVVASPDMCPDNVSSTEGLPITVVINPDCNLAVDNPEMAVTKIYPNPAKNVINVAQAQGAEISIFSLSGQRVLFEKAASPVHAIDISALAGGVYILEAATDSGNSKVKLIKN